MDIIEKGHAARAQIDLLKRRPPHRKADFQGIGLRIDRPTGYVQRGKDETGAAWERTYKTDYGYIPHTEGGDAEELDVYLGPEPAAPVAHWVVQRKADGAFDEFKLMLGFSSRKAAQDMWVAHTPAKFFGGVVSTGMNLVKSLLGVHPEESAADAKVGKMFGLEQWMDARGFDGALAAAVSKAAEEADIDEPTRELFAAKLRAFDGAWLHEAVRGIAGPDPVVKRVFGVSVEPAPEELPERRATLLKADAPAGELRYVLGIVLEPDVVDSQDDTYTADTIRQAAWEYLVHFRNRGLQHKVFVNQGVELVESYIAPQDLVIAGQRVKAGTWLIGWHVIDDAIWEAIKSGALTGFSIGGTAEKIPLTPEAEAELRAAPARGRSPRP